MCCQSARKIRERCHAGDPPFLLGETMDSGFFVSFVNYFNGIINKIEKHRLFFLCYNGKRLKIQQDIVGKKGKKK